MTFIKERKKTIVIIIIFIIIIIYKTCNKKEEDDYNILISEPVYNENIIEEQEEEIIIHISGSVKKEGIIKLQEGARIADAIEQAGGLTEEANLSKINLAYKIKDGQKIYIPKLSDDETVEYLIEGVGEKSMENQEDNNIININTATQEELEKLSGIGEATASKIIEYRKKNGKFKNIEEIMNINGIGEAKFSNIKEKIEI